MKAVLALGCHPKDAGFSGPESFASLPAQLKTLVSRGRASARKNESGPGGTEHSDVESQEAHQEP
jgi:hypothetical protein